MNYFKLDLQECVFFIFVVLITLRISQNKKNKYTETTIIIQ